MARLQKRYIALEDKNFDFLPREMDLFHSLIEDGAGFDEMARQMNRNQLEVFLLYLDQLCEGNIEPLYGLVRLRKPKRKQERGNQ